jgi:hypothetical protein
MINNKEQAFEYLSRIPNIIIDNPLKGKILRGLIILTGLSTFKQIKEKYKGFSTYELMYIE